MNSKDRKIGDIMGGVNEAVKEIIIYKGNLIKNNVGYEKYIKSVLTEHSIISSEASEQTVEVFVKIFKMGAVDAMTYDVGAALHFCADVWTSQEERRGIFREKFLEE